METNRSCKGVSMKMMEPLRRIGPKMSLITEEVKQLGQKVPEFLYTFLFGCIMDQVKGRWIP